MTKELEPLVSISHIQLITGCNFITAERMQRIIERKAQERYKRTCKWTIKKSGAIYDVYKCTACGYEYAESRTDRGVKTELICAKFCPNCGAEVIE